jgi:hypothetical protein
MKVPDLVTGFWQDTNSVATPFEELGESYFDHLARVMDPKYRDPPLDRRLIRAVQPRASLAVPESEPLFLPDDDEIQELSGNPWVSTVRDRADMQTVFRPPTPLPKRKPDLKRSPPSASDDDEDEDIAYLGATVPLHGQINLGRPFKRRRQRIAPVEGEERSNEQLQVTRVEDDETPLREIEVLKRGCQACGCFCGSIGAARSGSG